MVICVGEILADMIENKTGVGSHFTRHAGGAPFNVACGIVRLGGSAGFYGCVGDDSVGDFLADFAKGRGLDYCNIVRDKDRNTTLAFVELDECGERSFSFYRKNTADSFLREKDIPEIADRADVVHLGSLPLSSEVGRNFCDKLITAAKAKGKRISFDVNCREGVFESEGQAKEIYSRYIRSADIVKLSESELVMLTNETDLRRGMEELAGGSDKAVFVTLGSNGSACLYKGSFKTAPAFEVRAIDTTGAGDAFFAGVLYKTDKNGLTDLKNTLVYANACGALTTLKKGATDSFPTEREVLKTVSRMI